MRILDVACGNSKVPGALGIDLRANSDADVLVDLNRLPWPLQDGAFDAVVCSHIVEHVVDLRAFMAEVHRVARPGAIVEVITPHFTSLNSWDDPTHLRGFSLGTLHYFEHPERTWTQPTPRFEVVDQHVTFGRSALNLVPRAVARLSLSYWERHLCYIFPARNLHARLRVLDS